MIFKSSPNAASTKMNSTPLPLDICPHATKPLANAVALDLLPSPTVRPQRLALASGLSSAAVSLPPARSQQAAASMLPAPHPTALSSAAVCRPHSRLPQDAASLLPVSHPTAVPRLLASTGGRTAQVLSTGMPCDCPKLPAVDDPNPKTEIRLISSMELQYSVLAPSDQLQSFPNLIAAPLHTALSGGCTEQLSLKALETLSNSPKPPAVEETNVDSEG